MQNSTFHTIKNKKNMAKTNILRRLMSFLVESKQQEFFLAIWYALLVSCGKLRYSLCLSLYNLPKTFHAFPMISNSVSVWNHAFQWEKVRMLWGWFLTKNRSNKLTIYICLCWVVLNSICWTRELLAPSEVRSINVDGASNSFSI